MGGVFETFPCPSQMPQLKPETISMTGLNLFQHLCNLARLATSAYDSGSNCEVHTHTPHTQTVMHTIG